MSERDELSREPDVRASDAERDRVAKLLGDHSAAGRLSPAELSERLDETFAARTRGELAAVLRELPSEPLKRRSTLRVPHVPPVVVGVALIALAAAVTGSGWVWLALWPLLASSGSCRRSTRLPAGPRMTPG